MNGTVATAPTELDLKFSESVELAFTGVTITGPDSAAVATGNAALGVAALTRMAPYSQSARTSAHNS